MPTPSHPPRSALTSAAGRHDGFLPLIWIVPGASFGGDDRASRDPIVLTLPSAPGAAHGLAFAADIRGLQPKS